MASDKEIVDIFCGVVRNIMSFKKIDSLRRPGFKVQQYSTGPTQLQFWYKYRDTAGAAGCSMAVSKDNDISYITRNVMTRLKLEGIYV